MAKSVAFGDFLICKSIRTRVSKECSNIASNYLPANRQHCCALPFLITAAPFSARRISVLHFRRFLYFLHPSRKDQSEAIVGNRKANDRSNNQGAFKLNAAKVVIEEGLHCRSATLLPLKCWSASVREQEAITKVLAGCIVADGTMYVAEHLYDREGIIRNQLFKSQLH